MTDLFDLTSPFRYGEWVSGNKSLPFLGNFIRTVDMGRPIGVDAKTGGQSTSFMTVITDSQGNLVNTFPGKTF